MPSSTGLTVEQYKQQHRQKRRRHWLRWGISCAVLTVLLVAGGLAFKSWWTLRHVIARHSGVSSTALTAQAAQDPDLSGLTKEGGSRVNILLLGVGDPSHAGSTLSDTMMVASIDLKTKNIVLLSLPRDLYVPIPGHGSDKINSANAYGELKARGGGPDLAKLTVGQLLDEPIHNYIRVDFSAFKQGVNALGGVSVNVTDSLYDSDYPCDRDEHYACGFSIKAGTQNLTGDVALKYVRCRKGNCGNDFGRATRQQQVLMAMRAKALSLSTLTNPAKIAGLIDAVGDNAKTDLSLAEIQNLAGALKEIDPTAVTSKVLDNSEAGLVTTANIGGASVVIPRAGVGNFTAIRELTHSLFIDRYITSEKAKIVVHNATGQPALGKVAVELLKSYNYTIESSDDVPVQTTSQLVDYGGDKVRYTRRYLELRYKLTANRKFNQSSGADLELTIGKDQISGMQQ